MTSKAKTLKKSHALDEFWKHHHLGWNRSLNKRKDLYYKLYRYESLLDLYGTYLHDEPLYIRKKFRNNKVYVRSARERKVIEKSNLQKFQNKCELLKIRREDYANYLLKKDHFITDFIENTVPQEEAKNELLALFWEEIVRDIIDVKKTLKSTSEAHLRDKESYLRKRRISNRINSTELPEPFVTEIYQQRAAQTNATGINTNRKNTLKNVIKAESESLNNAKNN